MYTTTAHLSILTISVINENQAFVVVTHKVVSGQLHGVLPESTGDYRDLDGGQNSGKFNKRRERRLARATFSKLLSHDLIKTLSLYGASDSAGEKCLSQQ